MVTDARAPASGTWVAVVFFAVFALGGAVLLGFALMALFSCLNGVHSHAPIVQFQPHDAVAIGPAISLFAFSGLTLLPDGRGHLTRPKKGRQRPGARDPATILLAIAFIGIGLSFLVSPLAQIAVGRTVEARGYLRCLPPKTWDRHAPMRWALSGSRCP